VRYVADSTLMGAMPSRSAGILLHRGSGDALEVLLVHPGGPYWARKDAGAWSIPKGEHDESEDSRAAAVREFEEETGQPLPLPPEQLADLGTIRQRGGKEVRAWAGAGALDVDLVVSNTFSAEWPPRSGRMLQFPEVDRAAWFSLAEARERINPAQAELLDRL
jgi:predicted NUDIX family NTP pyrophosphohydrolase